MHCPIETSREADGRWMTRVPALPGLQVYEHSREESQATARKLASLLLPENARPQPAPHRILVFYPWRRPNSAPMAA